jgi:hypothetical protein
MEDKAEKIRLNARAREKKYRDNKGLISKAYKLQKIIVNDFASACAKKKVPQNKQLMSMMSDFIKQVNENSGETPHINE